MAIYKAMYKYQLANAADVSTRTFNRWLKKDKEALESLGFESCNKLLNPSIVKFLCEKYVIEL